MQPNDSAPDPSSNPATDAQQVLHAASHHDLDSLQILLKTHSASIQDPSTGSTPLHAAIEGAAPPHRANGNTHIDSEEEEESEKPAETVKLLLQNGAIWNDLDRNDETPGCLALRLGLLRLYDLLVDAGVRAEVLLSRLEGYERIGDDDGEDDDEEEEGGDSEGARVVENTPQDGDTENDTDTPILVHPPTPPAEEPQPNQPTYLSSPLTFRPDRILDAASNGIMMSWETNLMSLTASLLAPTTGLRILNIGHGMGIIDTHFQSTSPLTHHIIEAHPDVLTRMRQEGWYEKPGVVIHEGKWQDVLPRLLEPPANDSEEPLLFDAIYFDTFAEPYSALRTFFEDFVIGLLDDRGQWGFFNGMGADRQVCYDVYTKVVELDLFEAGFDVEWTDVEVPDLEGKGEWEGVKRAYWKVGGYRLPICRFMR
ncbi:MAG: hypothetical protein Q9174_005819 [Haloplaca sp. 1 TL-2023]